MSPYFHDFPSFVQFLIGYINQFIGLVAALAIVVFMWGLVNYIRSAGGEHAKESGRDLMLWGIVALFALFAIGGIIALLRSSLLGAAGF